MDLEEMAARFETGAATAADAAAVCGVARLPRIYERLSGPKIHTAAWAGICVYVFETLTRISASMPAERVGPAADAYFGRMAARAIRAKAAREAQPAAEPASAPQPAAAEPPPPPPPPPPPVAIRRPPERPRGRIAAAILEFVPRETVEAHDWRGWDIAYRTAVCLSIGLRTDQIHPAQWDQARQSVLLYYREGGG